MKFWTTKEVMHVLQWARQEPEHRLPLEELASTVGRSPSAVKIFLRRLLPPGQRPWHEKRRWEPTEVTALGEGARELPGRSSHAIKRYAQRHGLNQKTAEANQDPERTTLTVSQLAADLGLSRASVYRLLQRGVLRRFKDGIAETSFTDLLRNHPEAIPYSKLSRDHREWLVLNGYWDPNLPVKRPTTVGILE